MLKNIDFPDVKDVLVAVVKEKNELNKEEWFVYVINTSKKAITNLMVTSEGFGKKEGREVKTTTLRRFLGDVEGESAVKVEPIHEDVFELNNQYWVSFYRNSELFDKKYLFTAGAIADNFLTTVPIIGGKGIIHP